MPARRPLTTMISSLLALMVLAAPGFSEVPGRITYQGYIADTNGNPVDGTYPMGFAIYDDPEVGSLRWSETQTVTVTGGVYTVALGEGIAFPPDLFDGDLYLQVEFNGETFLPRQPLLATPFAMRAAKADGVSEDGVTTMMIANSAVNGAKILDNTITAADLAANSVNASEIATNAVGTLEIANRSVTAADLAENYVNTSGDTMAGTLELSANLNLPETTATSGIIRSGDDTLIHTYGRANFFAGPNAGNLTMTGGYNTGGGVSALLANTTGSDNTAHGRWALRSNTEGSYNTAMGSQALYANTEGNHNTASGYRALRNAISSLNTAIGSEALATNTTGYRNTANGYRALYSNTTGYENAANGYGALYYNTAGCFNTANGYQALEHNVTGSGNSGFGIYAGLSNVTGYNNTFIGKDADALADGLTNATALGYYAKVDGENRVRIGNTNITQIGGNVAWSNLSDMRNKEDITDLDLGLDFITALRPVAFTLREGNGRVDLGFIAQEIEEILGTEYNILGIGGDAERTLSLRYTDFIAPLVKAIQEQQGQIEDQEAYIKTLEKRLSRLEALLIVSR